jgi:hypothetical protein
MKKAPLDREMMAIKAYVLLPTGDFSYSAKCWAQEFVIMWLSVTTFR